MKIRIQSPTRVDFAGGTLDCWPLYSIIGEAQTINLAISIWTQVELEPRADATVEVDIVDLGYKKTYKDLMALMASTDRELDLVRAQLRYWRPTSGFLLRTRSQSPVGGGLGGSSSLCVSLIKAFAKWMEKSLTTPEIVTLAHNLEAYVLKKPTGTQDYFPAIEPGLNIIHYTPRGFELEKLSLTDEDFKNRMSLIYTGQPHHSGLNNWQVIKAALDGDIRTLQALHDIKDIADRVATVCRGKKWEALPELFQAEFEARVRLSAGFTSERIERLREVAMESGAQAVKICGAGGGGCVLVWSAPDRREQVEVECQKSGFQVLAVEPVLG